jgi:prophage tail gpP-like protein
LVGKLECGHHLEDNKCGWEDNIKVDAKELGWDGVDWIYVALCEPVVGSFNMLMTLEVL